MISLDYVYDAARCVLNSISRAPDSCPADAHQLGARSARVQLHAPSPSRSRISSLRHGGDLPKDTRSRLLPDRSWTCSTQCSITVSMHKIARHAIHRNTTIRLDRHPKSRRKHRLDCGVSRNSLLNSQKIPANRSRTPNSRAPVADNQFHGRSIQVPSTGGVVEADGKG